MHGVDDRCAHRGRRVLADGVFALGLAVITSFRGLAVRRAEPSGGSRAGDAWGPACNGV